MRARGAAQCDDELTAPPEMALRELGLTSSPHRRASPPVRVWCVRGVRARPANCAAHRDEPAVCATSSIGSRRAPRLAVLADARVLSVHTGGLPRTYLRVCAIASPSQLASQPPTFASAICARRTCTSASPSPRRPSTAASTAARPSPSPPKKASRPASPPRSSSRRTSSTSRSSTCCGRTRAARTRARRSRRGSAGVRCSWR